mmetsp:Transcript_41793/g.87229  ORF Transcript_41793/g.87229 Transcript_41793/m.87229 type:complete len:133 (+) Transcript_41793:394-792(+)
MLQSRGACLGDGPGGVLFLRASSAATQSEADMAAAVLTAPLLKAFRADAMGLELLPMTRGLVAPLGIACGGADEFSVQAPPIPLEQGCPVERQTEPTDVVGRALQLILGDIISAAAEALLAAAEDGTWQEPP